MRSAFLPAPGAVDEVMRRRVALAMLVAGALAAAAGAVILPPDPVSETAHLLVASTTGLLALGVAVRPRLSSAGALFVATVGNLSIGVLLAFADPVGSIAFFFLWPVVLVAYYFPRPAVVLEYCVMLVALVGGLLVNDTHELALDTFMSTAASVGLMAWLVATITDQQRRLRAELAEAAHTDALTGVRNRRSFDPLLRSLVGDLPDTGTGLTVVMFDIDHFKALNDEHGHLVGDATLREVAEALEEESREGDLVARFGGEEFIVALPGADLAAADAYARRVAASIAHRTCGRATVSVSAGIAAVGSDVASVDEVVARADEALYAAKAAGRCRPAVWRHQAPMVGRPFELV